MKAEIEKFLEKKGYDPKDIFKQIAITNVAILMQQYADEVRRETAVNFELRHSPGSSKAAKKLAYQYFDNWFKEQEEQQ